MAIQAVVNKNGLSGTLYITIVNVLDEHYNSTTVFTVRGFRSREDLYSGNAEYAYDETFEIPLIDESKPTRKQLFDWLKENKFTDYVDIVE